MTEGRRAPGGCTISLFFGCSCCKGWVRQTDVCIIIPCDPPALADRGDTVWTVL